jgi:hypothetical protein
MAQIPAYCPDCKSIFPSPIGIGGGVRASFAGLGTNCPVCGSRKAQINEGLYTSANDTLTLISGPDFSRKTLELFQGITKQFTEGIISKEEAQRQARDISPQLEILFNRFFTFGIPALTLLVALISLYLQYEGNVSSSEDSKKILDALLSHPYSVQEFQDETRINEKGERGAEANTHNKSMPASSPPERKPSNRQKKRIILGLRRRQFSPDRSH